MPTKSKKQLKYIYDIRNKYKNKENAPKDMKWCFGKEYTDDTKLNSLTNVMNFKSFTESMISESHTIRL